MKSMLRAQFRVQRSVQTGEAMTESSRTGEAMTVTSREGGRKEKVEGIEAGPRGRKRV